MKEYANFLVKKIDVHSEVLSIKARVKVIYARIQVRPQAAAIIIITLREFISSHFAN